MRRFLAGFAAVLVLAATACAADATTRPEERQFSSDEQQIIAAVIAAEVPNWRQYKLFFASTRDGGGHTDLPSGSIELMAVKGFTFKPYSACIWGADRRFLDRKTNVQGCVAEIDSVQRKDAETYFVRGAVYTSAWRGGGFQWLVVRENGKWIAKRRESTWVS